MCTCGEPKPLSAAGGWPPMSLSPHVPMASGAAPQTPTTRRKSPVRRWIILLLCIAAVIYFGGDYVIAYTDDAYVQSDFVTIARAPPPSNKERPDYLQSIGDRQAGIALLHC